MSEQCQSKHEARVFFLTTIIRVGRKDFEDIMQKFPDSVNVFSVWPLHRDGDSAAHMEVVQRQLSTCPLVCRKGNRVRVLRWYDFFRSARVALRGGWRGQHETPLSSSVHGKIGEGNDSDCLNGGDVDVRLRPEEGHFDVDPTVATHKDTPKGCHEVEVQ